MASFPEIQQATPHNLDLYRLQGFSGARRQLLALHEWLTGGDDLPAIAISGEQGNGKSTLATAAAWNNFHHFSDGIIRVSAAGTVPFRLYDVVRTLDTVLNTTLTRVSEDRWGISILEQLYKRKRLLIIDKLAGARPQDLNALVDIIGHLHEDAGNSRVMLIDRNFSPTVAELVQFQYLHLDGLDREDMELFIQRRGPAESERLLAGHVDELYALTHGRPLAVRLALGLVLDYPWTEVADIMRGVMGDDHSVQARDIVAFAVESYAAGEPQVGPLLNRLVSAAGGASETAMRDLFWAGLGDSADLERVLEGLTARGLLERDPYKQRFVIHPTVRRYLEDNVMLLGEVWDRSHATYYVNFANLYQQLPQERWPEVDVEWGNIYKAADWCAGRVRRLFDADPMSMLLEPSVDQKPPDLPAGVHEALSDLRLARAYALALAYYAFWRHPLGILRWLAAGAVASWALKDLSDYAWLLANLGRQFFFKNAVEEGVVWMERAKTIFDQHDLLHELAYVYTDLGTSLRILDKPRQALDYFYAAFDCIAQLNDLDGLTTAYMNLGSAYYSLENYERALHEHRKALRLALRRQDEQSVASAYNNMGLALEGLDKPQDAQRAYEYALDVFRRIGDVTGISTCYNNLGSAAYARGEYAQALMWYELDLALSQHRGAWTDMAATLHNLGHVALEQKALDRAEAYFAQSRDLYAAFDLHDYVQEEEEMAGYIRSLSPQNG